MYRTIELSAVSSVRFWATEVLTELGQRLNREHDLKSAMAVTNTEREEVGLIVKLESGESVEILSDMIEFESDFVEIRGGHIIPIRAIERVEI